MKCVTQCLDLQVSNWVFADESSGPRSESRFKLFVGLISGGRSQVAAHHRWSAGECHKNDWLRLHSRDGARRIKHCLRALLSGNSTFHWNHFARLYLCIPPPSPPSATPTPPVLHDMLFILYYMCEWWNTLLSFSPSGCLFLSPSYLLLLSSSRQRRHFPSLTQILNPQAVLPPLKLNRPHRAL